MSAPNSALNFLISKFPKRYNLLATKYLYGLVQALATGDQYIETQVQATRDNLIAVTATGTYLDVAAARYGIVRAQGSGLLDSDFQELIPLMGMSPKQISHILLEIIDIFYGPYASHANTTSNMAEPFNLQHNNSLIVRLDDTQVTINFFASDFVSMTAATANEVAIAISNRTNGKLIGSVVSDIRTGQNYVNIRTSSIGSQGFVQVLGGSAQIEFLFPEVRSVTGTVSTWDISRFNGTDEMVYTIASGPIPNFGNAGVRSGDFVTISPECGFNLDNTGTFKVSFVGSDFFRCVNPDGVIQAVVNNSTVDDFVFFKPDLGNVLLSSRPAALIETNPGQLTVIIPVTSPLVKKVLIGSHHFHNGVTNAISTTSNSVTGASLTAFDTMGAIRPVVSRIITTGIVSTTSSSSVSLINGSNWPSKGAFWSASAREFFYYQGISGNILQNVTPTPPNSLTGEKIIYTERYLYTSITGNTLNGVFPDPSSLAGIDFACAGAQVITNYAGSYVYNPSAPFEAAENLVTLGQNIEQGQVTTLIQVEGDVSTFPSSGYFILEFGTDNQEGPIRYLSTVGANAIIADPSHIYEFDHPAGTGLRLVRQVGAYTPRTNGQDLPVYTTSTSPARDALAQYLRTIAAAGVQLVFQINVPSEQWAVLPNLYTTDPLATTLTPPLV